MINIFGSGAFDCECNEGFEGDGESCLDIDECADSPCGQNSVCTNLAGSFECACDSGFSGDDCEVSSNLRRHIFFILKDRFSFKLLNIEHSILISFYKILDEKFILCNFVLTFGKENF